MPRTFFKVVSDILVPKTFGGGWNLSIKLQKVAEPGDRLVVETKQTTDTVEEDDGVDIAFSNSNTERVSFDTFGRYVASGAIQQYEEE